MSNRLIDSLYREADKLQDLGLGNLAHELRGDAANVRRAMSALESARREYPRRKREAAERKGDS